MPNSKNIEVVLVEDDPYDAELLMRVFKKHNFASKVTLLKDGVEAIDYFFNNAEMAERDKCRSKIIFLDLKMPRVDGIEVLRRIKSDSRTRDIPVIILTGSKEERDLKNAYALGVTSYITKPLKSEQFVLLMSELGANFDAIERTVRILVLEDNPADCELIKRELKKSICNVDLEFVQDKNAFHDALDNFAPDIILTDYTVPGFNGVAAMYLARQHFPNIPTIIVSGTIGDELAVEVLKSGANDYILKSRLSRLGPVTNRALQEAKQVAERTKAEQEAKQAKEKAEKYLDIVGSIVLALDNQGRITLLNKKAYEILGYNRDELLGRNWFETCLPPEDRHQLTNVFEDWVQGKIKTPVDYENPIITKNGERRMISWHNSDIRNENGQLIGTLSSGEDITKRKQIEQQLEKYSKELERIVEMRTKQLKDSERLAAIGATAGMVGHDIRNPLQAITGDVFLLKSDLSSLPGCKETEIMKESLEGIEKNIEYINKIVQDLQDYARPLKPTVGEVDLQRLCEEVLFKNGIPDTIKASCKIEEDAKTLVTDATLLKRVLTNLAINAIQAMPDGGTLTILAYKDKQTASIVVNVQDTGVGIPESIKPKLFTPMFTTKSKGQGFGLAVVKRIVEALSGVITFESQEGNGTKFIMRFPPIKINGKLAQKHP